MLKFSYTLHLAFLSYQISKVLHSFQCVIADQTGYSLVVVNNKLGIQMIEKVKNKNLIGKLKLQITNFKNTQDSITTNEKSKLKLVSQVTIKILNISYLNSLFRLIKQLTFHQLIEKINKNVSLFYLFF